ncbi:MAG TPA: hypothetical protein PKH16_00250 [Aequorivita sp.]|nr:hypothetical protein [Aequorivita sp.]
MKLFAIFLILVAFSACNQKTFDSKEALLKYLQDEDNGYIQKKTVNGVDFSLMYRPTDLIVSQMLKSKKLNEADSLRKVYKDYLYFNLSIAKGNQEILSALSSRNDFGRMVNRLAFGMEEKTHLYTNKNDTIQILDYIYPRMFGTTNTTSVMFVYPNIEMEDVQFLHFSVEDIGIGTGDIKFKIPIKKIRNQPKITF